MRNWLQGISLQWRIWRAKAQLRILVDEQGSFELRAHEAREQRARVERELSRLRAAKIRLLRGLA